MSFVSRVAEKAAEVQLLRVLLTILAVPLYLLGVLIGVLYLSLRWLWAAAAVGFADIAAKAGPADDSSPD